MAFLRVLFGVALVTPSAVTGHPCTGEAEIQPISMGIFVDHELNERWENEDMLTDEQKKGEIDKLLIEPTNKAYERELGVKLVLLKVHFATKEDDERIRMERYDSNGNLLPNDAIMLHNFGVWTQEEDGKAEPRNLGLWHMLLDEGWFTRNTKGVITNAFIGVAKLGKVCQRGSNVGISSIRGCSSKNKSCGRTYLDLSCTSPSTKCDYYESQLSQAHGTFAHEVGHSLGASDVHYDRKLEGFCHNGHYVDNSGTYSKTYGCLGNEVVAHTNIGSCNGSYYHREKYVCIGGHTVVAESGKGGFMSSPTLPDAAGFKSKAKEDICNLLRARLPNEAQCFAGQVRPGFSSTAYTGAGHRTMARIEKEQLSMSYRAENGGGRNGDGRGRSPSSTGHNKVVYVYPPTPRRTPFLSSHRSPTTRTSLRPPPSPPTLSTPWATSYNFPGQRLKRRQDGRVHCGKGMYQWSCQGCSRTGVCGGDCVTKTWGGGSRGCYRK